VDTVDREVITQGTTQSTGPLSVRVRKARGVPANWNSRVPRSPLFVLDVTLEIPAGINILFGPSGAGKSTLLDCIAGLVLPDSGHVAIGQNAWFDSERRINLPAQRRRIGYVFQSLALFPHLTVERNIAYGIAHLPLPEKNQRLEEIMSAFGIADLRWRKPAEISGGEAQRVELARALVTDPRVLLLDEPMSGLDEDLKAGIIADLRAWRAAKNIPILYVTHSKAEARALGDYRIVMRDGKIVEE
jgi:molybdate transport system ATP-binding protein